MGIRHLGSARDGCSCRAIVSGVRPLFYTGDAEAFLFASEIKALFAHPGSSREIDLRRSIRSSLSGRLCARARSSSTSELPPGHSLVDRRRHGSRGCYEYWRPTYRSDDALAMPMRVREELLRAARGCDAHPAARRCAGRRVSERRARLDASSPPSSRACARSPADVLRHVRRCGIRRERDISTRSFAFSNTDHSRSSVLAPATSRRCFPTSSGMPRGRSCGRRRRRCSCCRDWCAKRLQGRADRRRRRRNLRRLRHLQGSQDPPRSGRRSPHSARRPLLLKRLYPYLPEHPGAARRVSCRRSSDVRPRTVQPILLASAAMEMTATVEDVVLDGWPQAQLAGYDARRDLEESLPAALRRVGCVLAERSISKPVCFRDTSSRPRATGWRWRTRSRAAFHSSTTASSSSPPRFRRRLKMKVLNEKYILKRAAGASDSGQRRAAHEAAIPRAGSQCFFSGPAITRVPEYVDELLAPERVRRDGMFNPSPSIGSSPRPARVEPLGSRTTWRLSAFVDATCHRSVRESPVS